MLLFLQQLIYYITLEVLDRHWRTFTEKQAAVLLSFFFFCCLILHSLYKASTVDDLLDCHTDFLDSCLKGCMLTDPRLVKALTQLLASCQQFCDVSDRKITALQSNAQLRTARVRGQGVRVFYRCVSSFSSS